MESQSDRKNTHRQEHGHYHIHTKQFHMRVLVSMIPFCKVQIPCVPTVLVPQLRYAPEFANTIQHTGHNGDQYNWIRPFCCVCCCFCWQFLQLVENNNCLLYINIFAICIFDLPRHPVPAFSTFPSIHIIVVTVAAVRCQLTIQELGDWHSTTLKEGWILDIEATFFEGHSFNCTFMCTQSKSLV